MNINNLIERFYNFYDRMSGSYYIEDHVRVYPEDIGENSVGEKTPTEKFFRNNYLNHRKFYFFASQFVKEKQVADIGCGSGYGVSIIKKSGARFVYGSDLSRIALRYARKNFGNYGGFFRQGITNLKRHTEGSFDVCVCSEVLEHIKEYHKEREALNELFRILKPGGLMVIGTPNQEMLPNHGFQFKEIQDLFEESCNNYIIYENALIPPPGPGLDSWKSRYGNGMTGRIISQNIVLDETVLPDIGSPVLKIGAKPGIESFAGYTVDTTLLHNTHSWIIIAVKDE